MKNKVLTLIAAVTACSPVLAVDDVEQLKRELRELREKTEQLERRLQQIDSTNTGATNQTGGATAPAATRSFGPAIDSGGGLSLFRGPSGYLNMSVDGLMSVGSSTADDIEALNPGGHDPQVRGFTFQSLELIFDGAIDPYFRGFGAVDFHIDSEGETGVELEEAYLETISLPGNLQLRAGQFYTDFGRHNPTHAHAWAFVDAPLVNSRLLGPEGLRNPGARLAWLAPLPNYTELSFSVQNSHGETAEGFRNSHEGEGFLGRLHNDTRVKSFDDMLLASRLATSIDLTASQTLLAGLSAALGPNASGDDTRTEIFGADLFWKWKSAQHHGGFPFVFWQTEAMLRRYEAGAFDEDLDMSGILDPGEPDLDGDGLPDFAPAERLVDYGFYTQLGYGFRKGWVAALRFDYVRPENSAAYEDPLIFGPDLARAERWRVSPNLTWYPSEFSKIRLQYNYDDRRYIGVDHSVWLQFEFLLGKHGAHRF
ncbi:MAG TPA: hypothetical protein VEH27_20280 [Methylomirabilota bacterium]|nr:hypothetical protein [Methylomirabilota bacterium]